MTFFVFAREGNGEILFVLGGGEGGGRSGFQYWVDGGLLRESDLGFNDGISIYQ